MQSLHGISGDHVVLRYTQDGKFIRAFVQREQTWGNNDLTRLGNPSDVNSINGKVYVSDGNTNCRLIAFEEHAGQAFGIWVAYEVPPMQRTREDAFEQSQVIHQAEGGPDPEAYELGSIVHCSVPSGDGQLYLYDRVNNRAQVSDKLDDGSLRFVRNLVIAPKTGGLGTVTYIALSPDKKSTSMSQIWPTGESGSCCVTTKRYWVISVVLVAIPDSSHDCIPSPLIARAIFRLQRSVLADGFRN